MILTDDCYLEVHIVNLYIINEDVLTTVCSLSGYKLKPIKSEIIMCQCNTVKLIHGAKLVHQQMNM